MQISSRPFQQKVIQAVLNSVASSEWSPWLPRGRGDTQLGGAMDTGALLPGGGFAQWGTRCC